MVAWATNEDLTLYEKARRYYEVHRRLVKHNPAWKLRDRAELFGQPAHEFMHIYAAGRVIAQEKLPLSYMVITMAESNDPFVTGELIIADQSGLEVCGKQRNPRKYPTVWWEEFKDATSAIKRAITITSKGG